MLGALTVSALTFCSFVPLHQDTVSLGETVRGEITESASPIETAGLQELEKSATSIAFKLELENSDPVSIELRSYFFDAYLVLRDSSGAVIAEDDNGLTRSQARIVVLKPQTSAPYAIEVCSLDGEFGQFELLLSAGVPDELSRQQQLMNSARDVARGLKVLESANGAVHESLLPLLDEFGLVLEKIGDFRTALKTYKRALKIRTELLGEDDPATVESMNILGIVLKDVGEFEQALEPLERVLEIRLETLGASHQDTAISQENLGVLYGKLGRYAEAEELCVAAAQTIESIAGEEHTETLTAKNNVALALRARGKYDEAEAILDEILEVRERTLGKTDLRYAHTLANIASLRADRGQYGEGRRLQAQSLAIYEAELGGEHPHIAQMLNSLASHTEYMGDSASARPLFERALAIQEKVYGEESYYAALTLRNFATLLGSQGLLEEGQEMVDRCVKILRKVLPANDVEIALALNNQGSILKDLGQNEAALAVLREALQIAESSEEPGQLTASILSNIVPILNDAGRGPEAREMAQRALEVGREVHGPNHVQTARYMSNLMVQLVGKERAELGPQLLASALEIVERELEPGHALRVTIRANLGSLFAERGQWKAAWETVRGSPVGDLRRVLATATEEQSYRLLANRAWQLELEQTYAAKLTDENAHTRTYESVLNWKGQVAASLETNRGRLHLNLTDQQQTLLTELRGVQSDLSALAFNIKLAALERDARIGELITKRKQLELRAISSIESTVQPTVSLAQVRAALPESAAIIDFSLCRGYEPALMREGHIEVGGRETEHRVLAWVLGADKEHPVPLDLGPARAMQACVREFLVQLRQNDTAKQAKANAKLRELLWDPIASLLGEADLVLVSPDNFLGTLPLGTIELADGSFLLEHKAFVYTQNIAGIATRKSNTSMTPSSLLCVGNVEFGEHKDVATVIEASAPVGNELSRARRSSAKFGSWQALPDSGAEARAVEELHAQFAGKGGKRILLEGSAASEERLRLELPGKSVVHLATHGFFRPTGVPSMWEAAREEPSDESKTLRPTSKRLVGAHPGLLTGLVCAGANTDLAEGTEDGYLTAEEIGWLDLSKLDLIVLSACETGLGIVRTGEGLIGLRRAFAAAGADTVICSLWAIEDESTSNLMRSFYERLWKGGAGKLEALRAAQLEMLANNRELRLGGRPDTWGAFVLSGDWR